MALIFIGSRNQMTGGSEGHADHTQCYTPTSQRGSGKATWLATCSPEAEAPVNLSSCEIHP